MSIGIGRIFQSMGTAITHLMTLWQWFASIVLHMGSTLGGSQPGMVKQQAGSGAECYASGQCNGKQVAPSAMQCHIDNWARFVHHKRRLSRLRRLWHHVQLEANSKPFSVNSCNSQPALWLSACAAALSLRRSSQPAPRLSACTRTSHDLACFLLRLSRLSLHKFSLGNIFCYGLDCSMLVTVVCKLWQPGVRSCHLMSWGKCSAQTS